MSTLNENELQHEYVDADSSNESAALETAEYDRRKLFIPLGQLIGFALFILPSWYAYMNPDKNNLISVVELMCLGFAAVSLSLFSLVRGGADSLFDSLVPFILGSISLIGASSWSMISVVSGHAGGVDQWYVIHWWIELTAVLLVVLVVCSFAYQMFRVHRVDVIHGLSNTVLSGLVCISVAGWNFMPALAASYEANFSNGVLNTAVGRKIIALTLVAVAIAFGLCCSSWRWWSNRTTTQSPLAHSWLAMILIPIMLSGALVVLLFFGIRLVFI